MILMENTCGHPEEKHFALNKCKRCWFKDYNKVYRQGPKHQATRRAHKAKNRVRLRAQDFVTEHKRRGIKVEYNEVLWWHQHPATHCACCEKLSNHMNLDVNPKTGSVRSWTCILCNTRLGIIETPSILEPLHAYVRTFEQCP